MHTWREFLEAYAATIEAAFSQDGYYLEIEQLLDLSEQLAAIRPPEPLLPPLMCAPRKPTRHPQDELEAVPEQIRELLGRYTRLKPMDREAANFCGLVTFLISESFEQAAMASGRAYQELIDAETEHALLVAEGANDRARKSCKDRIRTLKKKLTDEGYDTLKIGIAARIAKQRLSPVEN